MSRTLLVILLFISINVNSQEYSPVPATPIPVTDTFYSRVITDNYRWMEDIDNNNVKKWLIEESKLTKKFLNKAAANTNVGTFIEKLGLSDYDFWEKSGNYFFGLRYYNAMGSYALFYKTDINYTPHILVDPIFISSSDNISIKNYSLSHDSKYLAYEYSRNGSDWAEVRVISMENGDHLKDHITGLKFLKVQWFNNGFFYSTYEQKDYFGKTLNQKVFYHKLGTDQNEDVLIFQRKNHPERFFDFNTTDDDRYFFLYELNSAGKYNVFYIDNLSPVKTIRPFMTNIDKNIKILDHVNGYLIARTHYLYDNGTIYKINPANPYNLTVIVPHYSEALLEYAKVFSDKILTVYRTGNTSVLSVYDFDGKLLYGLKFPLAISLSHFSGNKKDDEIYFYYTSYTIPPVVYKFNMRTLKQELVKKTMVNYDFSTIKYKEVTYKSYDGTKIPMILIYDKKLTLNGKNPVILKAYGGYGVITHPSFDPGVVYYIKHGGIFAFAEIRGGGEKGKEWHIKGRGNQKHNSFDDFNAAAEFLITNKYTNPKLLAATGASNGGLTVATAAIKRPDLYGIVVPIAGPYDMIRYENFTVGHYWSEEYGSVSDSNNFYNLLDFSPYHNIKENVNYPEMLVIASEYDDRVPPFHAYKFVARLQNRKTQQNPILLKLINKEGHNNASTHNDYVKYLSDIYGFIYYYQKKELNKKKKKMKISRL